MRRGVFVIFTLGVLFVVVASAATKGVMKLALDKAVYVDGKSIGPGPCRVSWATHSPEATVSFAVGGTVVAEARGRFVERDEKSVYDALVTTKDNSGNDVVREIRFIGKKSVLVLD